MAQVVTGVVGGVIGFFVGGPTGAWYGFQIGYAAGSYMFAEDTTIQGSRLGEIAGQTSSEGAPRPIIYGTSRPIGGNVMAAGAPIIRIKKQEQDRGKGGGGSTTVESEEVYRTYAIRICEGPVSGIRRVWRNNNLVYDADSTDPTQIENNEAFLDLVTFYLGGFEQMPDPAMEAAFGAVNVSAYRGTCYMVADNENLTPLGGAIPQYVFEVYRCEGVMLTSRPYSLYETESLTTAGSGWGIESIPVQQLFDAATLAFSGFELSLETNQTLIEFADGLDLGFAAFDLSIEDSSVVVPIDRENLNRGYASLSINVKQALKVEIEPDSLANSYVSFSITING